MNCCLTSKPCLNGGSCKPSFEENISKRYSCICPVGYTGRRCERPIKSCRDYADVTRAPGRYRVFSDSMDLFEVFCDFDSDSSMAWTLIQSYSIKNVEHFRNSFYINEPTRKVPPPSWHAYRISKSKMQSIQRYSQKWRITCQYDTEGVVYRDYIRTANDKIDILNFNGEECIQVEYIDIRGKNCSNCTVFLLQSHNTKRTSYLYPLHADSWRSNSCSHETDGILCFVGGGEDNFGYYHCQNTEHRCSASINATTQTWFGGDSKT